MLHRTHHPGRKRPCTRPKLRHSLGQSALCVGTTTLVTGLIHALLRLIHLA
jgi:hypothetical protein